MTTKFPAAGWLHLAIAGLCLTLSACGSSGGSPSSPCRLELSGAVTYSGSCTVSAAYDPTIHEVVLSATGSSDAGMAFSASILVNDGGTAFDGGTFTASAVDSFIDDEVFSGNNELTSTIDVAVPVPNSTENETNSWTAVLNWADQTGTMLLSIPSAGASSTVNGVQTWNGLQGSLVATLPAAQFPGYAGFVNYTSMVYVSMSFDGAATALTAPPSTTSASATVSTSGQYAEDGTFPLGAVTAFSLPGSAILEVAGGSIVDGGAGSIGRNFGLELQIPTLAAGTYTSANTTSEKAIYESNEFSGEMGIWDGADGQIYPFSVTITDPGTASTVDGTTVYTGTHGSFSVTIGNDGALGQELFESVDVTGTF